MEIVSLRSYDGNEPFVFVNYHYLDADAVYPQMERLGRCGCRIWYDETCVPGTRRTEESEKHLSRASAYLAFLSKNALQSDSIRKEAAVAAERGIPLCAVLMEPLSFSPETEPLFYAAPQLDKNAFENEDLFFSRLLQLHIPEQCCDAWVRASALETLPALPAEPEPAPAPEQTPAQNASPAEAPKKKKLKVSLSLFLFIGAVALALLIGFLAKQRDAKTQPAASPETASADDASAPQTTEPPAMALPENLRDFSFTLEGDVFALPCTLGDLTAKGWTVISTVDPLSAQLNGSNSRAVTLEKGGKTVTATFFNFSGSAKTLGECSIGGMDCFASDGASLTLSGGISCLSSPDEIRAAFGKPTEESVRGDYTVLKYAAPEVFDVYVEFVCFLSGNDQSHSSVRMRNFVRE